ncbi:hypothetical protein [Actinosynnema sp. NPDC020468]|uniref:hypothetical protein n=1 Tax=Actinosynnema sp. NPDC020468 TaxID=3154488 RepID=UPI00340AD8A5
MTIIRTLLVFLASILVLSLVVAQVGNVGVVELAIVALVAAAATALVEVLLRRRSAARRSGVD